MVFPADVRFQEPFVLIGKNACRYHRCHCRLFSSFKECHWPVVSYRYFAVFLSHLKIASRILIYKVAAAVIQPITKEADPVP